MTEATTEALIASLEATLAALRAREQARNTPPLLELDPRFDLPLQERPPDLLRQVINPYLKVDEEGVSRFARPFWMKGLMAATAGVSEADYGRANLSGPGILGGTIPRHMRVLTVTGVDADGHDVVVISSPGTPSIGWIPAGADYWYDPDLPGASRANFKAWLEAGCPRVNRYGDWSQSGLPYAYYLETNKRWDDPTKDLRQPGFPGTGSRGRGKDRHRDVSHVSA